MGDPAIRLGHVRPRQDADAHASCLARTFRDSLHDPAEAAADHEAFAGRKQPSISSARSTVSSPHRPAPMTAI